MTVTTIFGDLEWGDPGQLQEFLSNHDQAHRDINAAMAGRGVALGDVLLAGWPDNDWFARHWLLHKALDRALNIDEGPGLSRSWTGAQDFYDWHNINNNAHVLYAQALGVD